MNCIRALAGSLAVAATSLLVGCMAAPDSSDPSVDHVASAVQLYNVRSGPGFGSPIVYQLAAGTRLQFDCYTNDASGNEWFKLSDGNFILGSSVTGRPSRACIGVGGV